MQRILSKRVLRDIRENLLRYLALFFLVAMVMYMVVAIVGASETIMQGTEESAAVHHREDGQFGVFVPLTDDEIAEVLKTADELSKWASDVYSYAQDQAIVHHKVWKGFKLVMGKSNRKYTSEEEVAAAASAAGYTDIYKKSLIGITEMERLMGKKEFARILGALVYKPEGKVTLVPESDKRKAIQSSTAAADFKEED